MVGHCIARMVVDCSLDLLVEGAAAVVDRTPWCRFRVVRFLWIVEFRENQTKVPVIFLEFPSPRR